MEDKILETDYIDANSRGIVRTMFDGNKITIGKNVEDFYMKLIDLPISYKCQLMNFNLNELSEFIKESQTYYNEKLISIFKKKWIWRIDGEIYDFKDKEINDQFFGFNLDKNQIISKLKRNTFNTNDLFIMIDFFEDNEDIREQDEE